MQELYFLSRACNYLSWNRGSQPRWDRVLHLLLGVAEGTLYLHSLQIIHGDLKVSFCHFLLLSFLFLFSISAAGLAPKRTTAHICSVLSHRLQILLK